jgi:hypothetical protein
VESETSVVGPLLCVMLTAGWFGWCLRTYRFGEASRHWPRVPGTIIELSHGESFDEDAPGHVTFSSHMRYTYVVSGRMHRSTRFTFRPTYGLRQQDAYAMLRGLRRGQSVDVHYDPSLPSRAVVITGAGRDNTEQLVFAGLLLVASIGWLLVRIV